MKYINKTVSTVINTRFVLLITCVGMLNYQGICTVSFFLSKNVESEAFVGEGQPSGGVIEMNELTGDDELYSYGDALYYFVTSAITGTCMISTEDTMFFKDGQGNEIPVRIQVNHFIMQGDSNYVLVNNILAASRYDKVTKECVSK